MCGREGICVIDTRFFLTYIHTNTSSFFGKDGGVREEVTKRVEVTTTVSEWKKLLLKAVAAAFNDREK